MCPVEASPEYPLTVVKHRPFYFWGMWIIGGLVAIALAVGSYYAGYYQGSSAGFAAMEERDTLVMAYSAAEKEIQQLEQSVANLNLGSQVDRKATEQVRVQVVELKNRISELERDNTFYRDLMRPEGDDKGIEITAPSLVALPNNSNAYDYKMMVKQLSVNRLQLSGYIEVTFVGKDINGKRQRFELHQLSEEQIASKIKLNFRYFQRIEGRMVLPDGFSPTRIEFKMVSLKPKKALIEKKFTWVVDEV